jgi:hypothetical protein
VPQIAALLIDFPAVFKIDFGRKICHSSGNGRKALRRSPGKALLVDIYERGDRRYHVVWTFMWAVACLLIRFVFPLGG